MKLMHLLPALTLVLAGSTEALAQPNAEVKSEYDRFLDFTSVSLKPGVSPPTGQLQFSLHASFKGTTPSRPNYVTIGFFSTHDDWEYLECNHVVGLVDGVRVKLGESEHKGSVGSGHVLEWVRVKTSFEEIEQMASAQSLEFKICITEFAPDEKTRDLMREFISVFPKRDSDQSFSVAAARSRAEEIKRSIGILKCNLDNDGQSRADVEARCGRYIADGQITGPSTAKEKTKAQSTSK